MTTAGGKKASQKFNVPFLGEIPLDIKIRIGGDQGKPIVISEPDSPITESFRKLAEQISARVETSSDKGVFKRVFKIS